MKIELENEDRTGNYKSCLDNNKRKRFSESVHLKIAQRKKKKNHFIVNILTSYDDA